MAESIRAGNIKLVLCFVLYLAWWIVGFNPKYPIRGIKSGWLLIPAAILGVLALPQIWRGLVFAGGPVPGIVLVIGGVAGYVVLLLITGVLLKRPVTTELLIIVLWTTVMLLELNTLVAIGSIPWELGWVLVVLCMACAIGSLVCYQLFYGLESTAAFVDGMVPLLLACAMTGLITVFAR
ncbi:MAG: hypothetical protein Q4A01_07610 [Coriobacteriales bacterium]|nr:hypothetical protein [Coriobacteriales bacterium]